MRLAASRSRGARSGAGVCRHCGNARSAASIAVRVVPTPAFGTVAMTSSVAGFVTAIGTPSERSTHSPAIRLRVWIRSLMGDC